MESIEFHKAGGGEESGWLLIVDNPAPFDLVALAAGGIEQVIGTSTIEVGNYTQIRLNVIRVEINSKVATVPSDKLKIVGPFEVIEGANTIVTLDFNGARSVVVTGKEEFIFTPVVKLLVTAPDGTGEKKAEAE